MSNWLINTYIHLFQCMGRLISLVNFHEMALQSIWWRDILKDLLFELLQAKFQPESSCLIVIWSELGAQKSALPSTRRPTSRPLQWQNYELGYELISSSTLFFGFGPMWLLSVSKFKNWLGGKKFSSNEKVIVAVNEYFADFETAYFYLRYFVYAMTILMCISAHLIRPI